VSDSVRCPYQLAPTSKTYCARISTRNGSRERRAKAHGGMGSGSNTAVSDETILLGCSCMPRKRQQADRLDNMASQHPTIRGTTSRHQCTAKHDQCAMDTEINHKGNIIHAFASLNKLGKWLSSLPKLAHDAGRTDILILSNVIVQKALPPYVSLLQSSSLGFVSDS
jgi:hypothetical protein